MGPALVVLVMVLGGMQEGILWICNKGAWSRLLGAVAITVSFAGIGRKEIDKPNNSAVSLRSCWLANSTHQIATRLVELLTCRSVKMLIEPLTSLCIVDVQGREGCFLHSIGFSMVYSVVIGCSKQCGSWQKVLLCHWILFAMWFPMAHVEYHTISGLGE